MLGRENFLSWYQIQQVQRLRSQSQKSKRAELAAFVRSRRERLSPAQVGLLTTSRRRTPGLRREEVAQLAGIGVTWYTWLEQGRDIQVSVHFLDLIARALRLDGAERTHLFNLAHDRPPPLAASAASRVTSAHRRMLESLAGPAYLATARWDVVAWNAALAATFGDLDDIPVARRNMLWLIFASPDHRVTIPNWETDARAMMAKFRVEFGRRKEDPDFLALIDDLKAASQEFRQWWAEQDVTRRPDSTKKFHSKHGVMEFEQTTFIVDDGPDLRLTVYTPVNAGTARIVQRLKKARTLRHRPKATKASRR